MKFIFKKYADFESAHGTADSVEQVRALAIKYAESNSFDDADQKKKL